jgi:hypothetical protein
VSVTPAPREAKALFEAGITESNLRNLNYGDRDSKGAAAAASLDGLEARHRALPAALDFLARPSRSTAGRLRGPARAGGAAFGVPRAAMTSTLEAARFLAGVQTGSPAARRPRRPARRDCPRTPCRAAGPLAQFVLSNQRDPVALAQGIQALNQTQTTTKVRTSGGTSSGPSVAPRVPPAASRASSRRPRRSTPSTCPTSGAAATARPPRSPVCRWTARAPSQPSSVSLPGWPRSSSPTATQGRGKHVTIWAAKDGHHVLMEINGHFWGNLGRRTPAVVPAGSRARRSRSQYLSGFVARHPPGM